MFSILFQNFAGDTQTGVWSEAQVDGMKSA